MITAAAPAPVSQAGPFIQPGAGLFYQGQLNTSATTLTNGLLRVGPVYIAKQCTLIELFSEFTAAGDAGSTFVPALYADTGNGYPGALVALGTAVNTGGAPAVQPSTITPSSVVLTPGVYWIGGVVQNVTVTQPTMRTGQFIAEGGTSGSLPGANAAALGYAAGGVTGALPNPFPAGFGGSGFLPRVGFQIL